jgi:hypothetical protein
LTSWPPVIKSWLRPGYTRSRSEQQAKPIYGFRTPSTKRRNRARCVSEGGLRSTYQLYQIPRRWSSSTGGGARGPSRKGRYRSDEDGEESAPSEIEHLAACAMQYHACMQLLHSTASKSPAPAAGTPPDGTKTTALHCSVRTYVPPVSSQ